MNFTEFSKDLEPYPQITALGFHIFVELIERLL